MLDNYSRTQKLCGVIDIDFTTKGAINIESCVYRQKLLPSPY